MFTGVVRTVSYVLLPSQSECHKFMLDHISTCENNGLREYFAEFC